MQYKVNSGIKYSLKSVYEYYMFVYISDIEMFCILVVISMASVYIITSH